MHLDPQWVIVALTLFTTILIPTLWFMVRGAIKWTKVEDKLGTLVNDVHKLVVDQDKVHSEILEQMRVDREATDRRLRFIEEFWMKRGRAEDYDH